MADALHARYDHVADEAVPKRLEIERLVSRPRKWMYGAVAAALAAFICGGGVGWEVRGVTATPSAVENLTSDAMEAHRLYVVEVRHPVEVPGSERAHLQTWLTNRCGWEVRAPKLDDSGLILVGRECRLCPQWTDRQGQAGPGGASCLRAEREGRLARRAPGRKRPRPNS